MPIIPVESTAEHPLRKKDFVCPIYRMPNRDTGALDLPSHIMIIQTDDPNWNERSVAEFVTAQI